eukprot:scpid25422/ scgid33884/ Diacylglycerol kinase iota; Diglyceride kinase iota
MATAGRTSSSATVISSVSESTGLNVGGRAAAALASGSSINLNEFEMDWSSQARDRSHIWIDAEGKDHLCYSCGEGRSSTRGARQKCMVCKVVVHNACTPDLLLNGVLCRRTFTECQQETEDLINDHHWVRQRKAMGRCFLCSKHIITKLLKSSRDFHAIGCSWCKQQFHLSCYMSDPGIARSPCHMGEFRSFIVPPQWIIRLLRARHSARRGARPSKQRKSPFIIRRFGSDMIKPLLCFVNPKSGGNQGAKVLARLLWLLNPRQVFNLLQGGPEFGLQLYGKLPRLRILVCGGDGTVGWVVSVIDQLGIKPCPPIAVLPIGTGNDLSRTLGWGGKYSDESLIRILHRISTAAVVRLDRWNLLCQPGAPAPEVLNDHGEESVQGAEKPPLAVFNNYFSIGADALVALEFHESREANPERFNSRWFNKMFYAGAGGKEILERKSRDFSKYVGVLADGVDLTPLIRQERLAAVVFLNITHYSAGTKPWGTGDTEYGEARLDDGLIEVIGLNSMTMAALHLGRPGVRIAQAREVTIITSRALPVQVDGEPCRLAPSTLQIKFHNQANMLARVKASGNDPAALAAGSAIANLGELVQSMPSSLAHSHSTHFLPGDMASGTAAAVDDDEVAPVPATLLKQEDIGDTCNGGLANPVAPHEGLREKYSLTSSSRRRGRPGGDVEEDDEVEESSDNESGDNSPELRDQVVYQPAHPPSPLSLSNTDMHLGIKPRSVSSSSPLGVINNKVGPPRLLSMPLTMTMADSSEQEQQPQKESAHAELCEQHSVESHQYKLRRNDAEKEEDGWREEERDVPYRKRSECRARLPLRRAKTTADIAPGGDANSDSVVQSKSPASVTLPVQRPSLARTDTRSNSRTDLDLARLLNTDSLVAISHEQIDMDHSLVNACKQGNVDIVRGLHELGASLTNFDEQGLMPLHHAVRHNRLSVVVYLLQQLPKARLAVVDMRKRQTALHKAAWYGYMDIAMELVKAGSPLLPRDYEGLTAYQRSLASPNTELHRYLLELEQDRTRGDTEESRL